MTDLRVKVHALVVGAVQIFMLSATTMAAPLADAGAATARGDYATALRLLKPLAAKGQPVAQNMLGALYEQGKGAPQSYALAAMWYEKAARQGNPAAEANLAFLYDRGLGMQPDTMTATKWYRKAADQGDAVAQVTLGEFYAIGRGVSQDYREANNWFRKAANQGNADGETNLGVAYELGHGVQRAEGEAAVWYSEAAEQGVAKAQYDLGMLYENGRGVSQDYKQAAEWFGKAADQGYAKAQRELGALYQYGHGVATDIAKASDLYGKAAAQGDALAKYDMAALPVPRQRTTGPFAGIVDLPGSPAIPVNPGRVKVDSLAVAEATFKLGWYPAALRLARPLADRGDPAAEDMLGVLYSRGLGVPKDERRASVWYRKAANQDYGPAELHLGILYNYGEGALQNYAEASGWYRRAVGHGDATAEYLLGQLFSSGNGVPRNQTFAERLFSESADQGNSAAKLALTRLRTEAIPPPIPVVAQQPDEVVPPYILKRAPDGLSLSVIGGIRFGLARDIQTALDATPGITTINLQSPGGRFKSAEEVLQLIRQRGLDTFVPGECLAACTLIFVGGKHRTLFYGARLGFHGVASTAVAPTKSLLLSLSQETMALYLDAGVDEGFVRRAFAMPPPDLWYPTKEELVAAHVLIADTGPQDVVVPAGPTAAIAPPSRSFDTVH